MKKILSIFAILLFAFGTLLTSCSSSNSACPAYPPSVYHGDAGQQNINNDIINSYQNSDL